MTPLVFLKHFDPDGVHNLVAIKPDAGEGEGPIGVTIQPGDWPAAQQFIDRFDGRRNLYFSVNEPKPDAPNDKLRKEHIARIRAIPADVDPKGGDLDEARADIVKRARAALGGLAPAYAIDSGGGFQFYWKLADKLPADEYRKQAEDQARGLARLLEGDGVGNIDRIMRLPGTVNLPDAKKRAKGRTERRSVVLDARDDTTTLDALRAAYKPIERDDGEDSDEAVAACQRALDMGYVKGFASYGDLPEDLRVKFEAYLSRDEHAAGIWSGAIAPHDTSGSGWRFELAGLLKRAGGFEPHEFGALAWVWGRCDPAKLTARVVARDWVRADAAPDPAGYLVDVGGLPALRDVDPFAAAAEKEAAAEAARPNIRATPYDFPEPADIPRRQFLYGHHYVRQFVSTTAAPTKVGKSSLTIVEALAMASGKPLLGVKVRRPLRVWLWNGEDPLDELRRRVAAAMLHYGLTRADLTDENGVSRLFLDSGRDMEIVMATSGRDGTKIAEPVELAVVETIRENAVDVLVVDPFVSSHRVPENDNGGIDMVAKRWARIADITGSAVELVHHVRKLNGGEVTIEDARGASALISAARSARALARMTKGEGVRLGLDGGRARRLFRFADAQSNLALPAGADEEWMELRSVDVGNGVVDLASGDGADADGWFVQGDSVGVVAIWEGAGTASPGEDGAPIDEMRAKLCEIVRGGTWKKDHRSGDAWIGNAVAQAYKLDTADTSDRARARSIVTDFIRSGVLVEVSRYDASRNMRVFVEAAEDKLSADIFD